MRHLKHALLAAFAALTLTGCTYYNCTIDGKRVVPPHHCPICTPPGHRCSWQHCPAPCVHFPDSCGDSIGHMAASWVGCSREPQTFFRSMARDYKHSYGTHVRVVTETVYDEEGELCRKYQILP